MVKTNQPDKGSKKIQLSTSDELHNKILKCQSIYKLQGRKFTIPETCNFLLERAAAEVLKNLIF